MTSWRQVYYDDAASMRLRYALVNDYNLRGAGMWALGYDGGHPELYRAISESFLVDKAAPQAGVRLLSGKQADEGFTVSWTARDATAVASYDVQASTDGGAWTTWLTGTRATSDVWLGDDGHGYAFRVRATDTKGHVGAWNVVSVHAATPSIVVGGFGRVVTDGLSYRTGPDAAAGKLGTLSAGTIVAITRGPVSADGYTWYEVTQPIEEWSPVSFVERGVWVAVRSSTTTNVTAYRAPNSTVVDAGLRDLDFGAGGATGTGKAGLRAFSPDGDGSGDSLRIRWTATVALAELELNVYRPDGHARRDACALDACQRGPHLGLGREDRWDGGPRRFVRPAAGRRGLGQDVPCPIRQARHRDPGRGLRDHRGYHRPRAHVRHGVVVPDLAQRRRDTGLRHLRACRHRGDALGRAGQQRRGHRRPLGDRHRREGVVAVDRHERCGRAGARRQVHDDAHCPRWRRQQRSPRLPDRRGHDGARRDADDLAGRLLPEP